MQLIETARNIAVEAHAGQTRKYHLDTPYIVHPDRVREYLRAMGMSDTVCAAAQLHDVFEDCDQRFKNVVMDQCGAEVFILIHSVTNPSKDLKCSRALRKLVDREHLKWVSPDAIHIKLADRIDNLRDMLSGAPVDFKQLYFRESVELYWILERRTSHRPLCNDYTKALDELEKSIPK